MVPTIQNVKNHLILAGAAIFLEAVLYAIAIAIPVKDGLVILAPLLLPGTILQFFVAGGMSWIDGLTPEWRSDLGFALGFLLNTTLMYGCCLLTSKVTKIIRSEMKAS